MERGTERETERERRERDGKGEGDGESGMERRREEELRYGAGVLRQRREAVSIFLSPSCETEGRIDW